MELTPKQSRFVEEYLIDLNGAGAARRSGYSEKSACYAARRLLGLPHVAQAVQEAMEQRAARNRIRQDEVLGQLMDIAMDNDSPHSVHPVGAIIGRPPHRQDIRLKSEELRAKISPLSTLRSTLFSCRPSGRLFLFPAIKIVNTWKNPIFLAKSQKMPCYCLIFVV